MARFLRTTILGVCSTLALAEAQCNAPTSITCVRNKTSIKLDADLTEWTGVSGISTPLLQKFGGSTYAGGNAKYKCLHSDTHLYLTMEIPGKFTFNSSLSEKCAAISTMFKIGEKATLINMGGCPLAVANATACSNLSIPPSCDDYRVDLGAFWELATTTQGVEYGINIVNGTGTDVNEKSDEYSVAPTCRLFDSGAGAGNEWAGAWAHTNPTIGSDGTYIFELSRLLTTSSAYTDVQFQIGGTYKFGVAFWDPLETADGWTSSGHYISGCGTQFMDMVLGEQAPASAPVKAPVKGSSNSSATSGVVSRGTFWSWWTLGAGYLFLWRLGGN